MGECCASLRHTILTQLSQCPAVLRQNTQANWLSKTISISNYDLHTHTKKKAASNVTNICTMGPHISQKSVPSSLLHSSCKLQCPFILTTWNFSLLAWHITAVYTLTVHDRFNSFNMPGRSILPVSTQLRVGRGKKTRSSAPLVVHYELNTNCNSCSSLSIALYWS